MKQQKNVKNVNLTQHSTKDYLFLGEIPGKGRVSLNNGGYFKGFVQNMGFGGCGEMIYQDKSVYNGEILNGKRHGIGMMAFSNGEKYKGYWNEDMIYGSGYYYTKKAVYYGIWENNKIVFCACANELKKSIPLFYGFN